MTEDEAKCTDSGEVVEVDVFYHSKSGMVLAEQYGPVYITSTTPPSPFHYVRLVDYLKLLRMKP